MNKSDMNNLPCIDIKNMGEINNQDETSLLDMLLLLKEYKWLIFCVVALFFLMSTVYVFSKTPIYKAEILVAPLDKKGIKSFGALEQIGGMASLVGVDVGVNQTKDQVMSVLESRQFIYKFIEQENIIPILYAGLWNQSTQSWKIQSGKEIPTLLQAYAKFTESVMSTNFDSKRGVLTIAMKWTDPVVAAAWANRLVIMLNEYQQQSAINRSQEVINFLTIQLEKTSIVEIQRAINQLIEAETKNIMLARAQENYALEVVDPAVTPEEIYKPNRAMMIALSTFVGLGISVFLVFALAFLRHMKDMAKARDTASV